jgi:hypothetical protein
MWPIFKASLLTGKNRPSSSGDSRLRYWLRSPLWAPIYGGGVQSLFSLFGFVLKALYTRVEGSRQSRAGRRLSHAQRRDPGPYTESM